MDEPEPAPVTLPLVAGVASGQRDEGGEVTESAVLPPVYRVVPLLQRQGRRVMNSLDTEAASLSMSRRHLQRALSALAESCHRCQALLHENTLKYIQALHFSKLCTPILMVHHLKHDESPLELKVQYDANEEFKQVTKIVVVESRWSFLISQTRSEGEQFLLLSGTYATSLRASENATAETLVKILESCPQPSHEMSDMFLYRWRVVESDACRSNMRAEKLLADKDRRWPTATLHGVCSAHNCHHIATKCWLLLSDVLTGAINTLLVLKSPGAWTRFRDALIEHVRINFVVLKGQTLSDTAERYRERALRLWCPSKARRKAHSSVQVLSALLYNGDWRNRLVTHLCQKCCPDAATAKECALKEIPRLLRSLRSKMLSRADWSAWAEALSMIGLLSAMHGLFPAAFLRAFAGAAEQEIPQMDEEEEELDGAVSQYRRELTENLKKAVQFWQTAPQWRLNLLAVALENERQVMAEILKLTSVQHEHSRCQQLLETGGLGRQKGTLSKMRGLCDKRLSNRSACSFWGA